MAIRTVTPRRRNGKRSLDRRACLKKVAGAYTRKFQWCSRCVYCGMHAASLDHVFPVIIAASLDTWRPAVRKALGQGLNLVPSCLECNAIAGCNPFTSIRAKRDFIQGKLRRKLSKHLLMPDWSEKEIAALSYTMRTHIRAGLRLQKIASMRCNWPLVRLDA